MAGKNYFLRYNTFLVSQAAIVTVLDSCGYAGRAWWHIPEVPWSRRREDLKWGMSYLVKLSPNQKQKRKHQLLLNLSFFLPCFLCLSLPLSSLLSSPPSALPLSSHVFSSFA